MCLSFQSTLPAWGETGKAAQGHAGRAISIHSPRMGRDRQIIRRRSCGWYFNPLSPHGERPSCFCGAAPVPGDFNPLSPHGERPPGGCCPGSSAGFQSTLPAWGETGETLLPLCDKAISIHSPRMGRDPIPADKSWSASRFQSTLPAWGETVLSEWIATDRSDFNPLSPHGERPQPAVEIWVRGGISIHSPRMGRDPRMHRLSNERPRISIHSPRMGRDPSRDALSGDRRDFNPLSPHGERPYRRYPGGKPPAFQSTLPAWGETADALAAAWAGWISIHSPRMGRDRDTNRRGFWRFISIHSPRMGRDPAASAAVHQRLLFQSTLPAWGETQGFAGRADARLDFNPLSPHGERPAASAAVHQRERFQSTLPAWGETERLARDHAAALISIHSPRMGRDLVPAGKGGKRQYFNPLSPHGERPGGTGRATEKVEISIHSPRMGRDLLDNKALKDERLFQSTLPAWGETRTT